MSSRWSRRVAVVVLVTIAAAMAPHRPADAALPTVTTGPAAAERSRGLSTAALPVRPTTTTDPVAWANYERAFGENLAPITTNPTLSVGPQNHASWLAAFHSAGDPYCSHTQDATHTWPPGQDHSHNVLYCGPTSIGAAIEGWVDTPYHGAGFVDPAVGSIGFGFALDTSTALFASDGAPALSRWPMPGGVLPSPAMTSGESPEPRTACGYAAGPVGRPIFLTLPAPATFAGASVSGPTGGVASCSLHANPFEAGAATLDPGETTRQVAIITQTPYTAGQVYTASIAMSSGTYTWSFLVGDTPSAPSVTATPSGPGQVTVSWSADGHGLPITGYQVDDVSTGASQQIPAGQTSTTFAGLTPGAFYRFRVAAANELGVGSAADAVTLAITPPSAPVIVTALPGSASAFLSWSYAAAAAAPVTSFQMDLDGGAPIDIGADANRTVGGLLQGHAYSIRVRGVNGAGAGPWSEPRTVTPRAPGILFHGLPVPVRAVDSRLSGGPIEAGATRVVPVVAVTGAAPEAVAAISLNLTAADPTGSGYFTAWPCDQPRPEASSVNFAGGETGVPNHVIVPVAADGSICIYSGIHSAEAVIDVDGWFSIGAGLVPQSPHRELDTRQSAGAVTDIAVAAAPPGARAAIVNLTAAGGSGASGFVTAYACGTAPPLASNVNFLAGQVVANSAVVPVAADGSLCLHASTPTDLVVDVAGYVTDNFVPVGPTRVLDTRRSTGPVTGVDVAVTPPGVSGAVVNVTAAGGSTVPGFVTVHPADVPTPWTSNLDFTAGQIVPNAAVVRPDGNGKVHLAASTPVDLVVDVFGYFL